jgi:hypothetical protein
VTDNLKLQGKALNPLSVIVPIFGVGAPDSNSRFLGTGSIVGDGSILLTADHVIRDWPYSLIIVTMLDTQKQYWQAEIIERDTAHDLVLLRVDQYRPENPLQPAFDSPLHANSPLMTFEYGTTIVAGDVITLEPATRLGHITRVRNLQDTLGAAGDAALELSWPALRGASGAPVVFNDGTFRIVGIVIANVSYHLLPAQIESVLDDKNNLIEETKYMLPQAIAVNIRHVRPMYERISNARST